MIADYHLQKGETGIDVIAAARDIAGERLGAVLVSGDRIDSSRRFDEQEIDVEHIHEPSGQSADQRS